MSRNADAYTTLMLSLYPPGSAWPRDVDSVRGRILAAIAAEFARIDAAFEQILAERTPRTALWLLPEWEASLGLPDECTGAATTIAERRAIAWARMIATGGQSPAYFIEVARALGYEIEIDQFRARWYGRRPMGGHYGGQEMQAVWRVRVADTTRPRRYGRSYCGEPYTTWGNYPLVCLLRRLAPAHTTVLFS